MLQAEGRARGHLSLCCCSCVLEKEDILLALETAWEHRGLERLFSEPVQSWQPVGFLGSLLQVSLGQTLGTGHAAVWASLLRKGKTESPGQGPRWRPDLPPNWERGCSWWVLFCFFFSFIFISWRLITLQYCSGFCHTLTWISHGFYTYSPSRSLLPPPSLPDPSGSSQCTRPEHLSHAPNLGWWSVSPSPWNITQTLKRIHLNQF